MSKAEEYLRNVRHTNKFLFIFMDELFYEPFEAHYKPSRDYIDQVTDLAKEAPGEWKINHDGFWVYVNPAGHPRTDGEAPESTSPPVQGWKIHVSATLSNASSIVGRVARIAFANQVPFKFVPDEHMLSITSSKLWARGRSGKFITLFPWDLACFKGLIEELYEDLRDEEGPYVLSDKRYKDCRVLYYRYGGIQRTYRLEVTGKKTLVVISPDGTPVPDARTPYFAPPPWATDPFPTQTAQGNEIALKDGRYVVKEALSFSNSGGVYLADDRETGATVVIKEARAHTLMDGRGADAIQLLKKEEALLIELRGTGVAPEPLDSFHAWENFFLVEEYLEGLDIRQVMLTRSPLMRVESSREDSREYYEVFRQIFTSFARQLQLMHERNIVFGDLSAKNLKVDPSTWTVRFIDFEGAFRPGVDEPTLLFTLGFKREESIRGEVQGFEEDLYGLAASMLYMLFPVHALVSLKDDIFDDVLETMLEDAGWSRTPILKIIDGLPNDEITLERTCQLLTEPVEIQSPSYDDDIELETCKEVIRGLGEFLLRNMRDDTEDTLFPADPFVHQTNPLGLGFGACGVLYTLGKCDFEIPKRAYDWLERKLDEVKPQDLAPGLLTGASGIAWCLWELGLEERSMELMKIANGSGLLQRHHSYLYGMAGVGMANLHLHVRTGREEYLIVARDLADALRHKAKETDRGLYWENSEIVQLGFGYGQSGVALFFLRLFELTGDEELLTTGRRALEFDLSHGVESEMGGVSFPCEPSDPTLVPYLEEGSAGITKVAIRYGMWERTEGIFTNFHRKYSGFAGMLYGLAGFVDVFTDAFLLSGKSGLLEMAKRPLSGLRDLYLIEQPSGFATPGEGLFRVTCDYGTGVAGVLRAMYRYAHLEEADFVLDELAPAAGHVDEATGGEPRRQAMVNPG